MALILAIDTSCDETSAAVTDGRRVLSNVISSQIDLHKKYGGVFPALAKRAHEERIDYVVMEALKRARLCHPERGGKRRVEGSLSPEADKKGIPPLAPPRTVWYRAPLGRNDTCVNSCSHSCGLVLSAVAVTQGPGLAIALEVGIRKAKELARDWQLPLIAVNHLEGHICSCLATGWRTDDRRPKTDSRRQIPDSVLSVHSAISPPSSVLRFPALCLIVSGGHTQLVLMKDHGKYEVVGATLDDACGEALDKAARILKLGYPGGPIIERLAENVGVARAQPANGTDIARNAPTKKNIFHQPLPQKTNLNFSYSGLKTQLLYLVQSLAEKDFNASLKNLAASFQSVCFEQITRKTSQAIKIYQPKSLVCGGGVIANKYLRKLLRDLAKRNSLPIYFPQNKKLITDNAAMIGVAAYYKMLRGEFIEDPETLDREPRLSL